MTDTKSDSGAIIIETSIALPIFILVIVFMYSILIVVLAQNTMTHTLIQTTDSLALDAYVTNDDDNKYWWSSVSGLLVHAFNSGNSDYFTSSDKISGDTSSARSIAKKRFLGYLTGAGGTDNKVTDDEIESVANNKLDALSIVDGLDGIKFKVEVKDEDLTITIEYYIQFPIDAFGAGKIHMKQSFTSKMWS